jgi:hypothetical protein
MRTLSKLTTALMTLCLATQFVACNKAPQPEAEPSAKPSAAPSAAPPAEKKVSEPKSVAPDPKRYAWLGDKDRPMPAAKSTLAASVPTPPGYQRVQLEPGSFAAWLRDLPVAAPNTPVVDFRGNEVHPGNDDYVQAVIAIDPGKKNLQQSTDVILRLQAEWLWSQGRRDHTYKSATKDLLPFQAYSEGKRLLARAGHLYWVKKKDPNEPNDRAAFRDYLDVIFTWVNSSAIRMQSDKVDPKDIQPGDFFLQRGKGGYAVVILDIAEKPSGQRVALLGQSLYPAMNIYIARPGRATPWFSLRAPDPILTAHTKELKWADLRRLQVLASEAPGQ